MALDLRFYPDIPEGMCVLIADNEVAGVNYRLANARAFASGKDHALEFVPEPSNPHDPNAIKVIGVYRGRFFVHRTHVGYVPAEVAVEIAERGLAGAVVPRLRNIWWGGYTRDYIVIRFDVVGAKTAHPKYEQWQRGKRPLNFCGQCKHSWQPRGRDISVQCPRCRNPLVELVQEVVPCELAALPGETEEPSATFASELAERIQVTHPSGETKTLSATFAALAAIMGFVAAAVVFVAASCARLARWAAVYAARWLATLKEEMLSEDGVNPFRMIAKLLILVIGCMTLAILAIKLFR